MPSAADDTFCTQSFTRLCIIKREEFIAGYEKAVDDMIASSGIVDEGYEGQ